MRFLELDLVAGKHVEYAVPDDYELPSTLYRDDWLLIPKEDGTHLGLWANVIVSANVYDVD